MPIVYMPLKMEPICGHNLGPMGLGDLMIGREEGMLTVKGKHADYVRAHVFSSCSLCNKEAQADMEKEVELLEKEKKC